MKWFNSSVVGLFVLIPNAQAAVVYNEGFETGAVEAQKEATCYDKEKHFRIQSDIVRSGKYAAYLTKPANKGKRCEIVPIRSFKDVGNFIWGKEYWSGFSFYIPSGMPNTGFGLIHQHHADSPKGQPYCGYAGGNGFSIRMREEFSIHLTPSRNLNLPGKRNANSAQEIAYTFPLQKDKWFDVVMNFKYSDKSDGFWKIWVNGKQVIERTGSNVNLWMGPDPENLFKGACGSNKYKDRRYYQQHGIYVGSTNAGAIVYDEVKLGDANSSYAEVVPGGESPPKPPLEPSPPVINPDNGFVYEGEKLSISDSSGDNIFIANNKETSNGQFFLYKSNSVDDYITFDVNVAQAGTYDIALDYWGIAKRGAVQLSIDGTNVGAVVDQHTSPDGSGATMIGEYSFSTAGIYKFTFTNTQRNASSSSDKFSIDAIRLLENNAPTSYEGEKLSISDSSGDNIFIANNEETSNGQFFLYKSNSVGDYVTFDVNVAQAGTYDIALDYWGIAKRGAVQLSIDGTNVGAVVDQHTSPDGSGTAMIGEYSFSTAGIYKFTFTNTQRNASSSSDKFSIDAISLLKTNEPVNYEGEELSISDSSGDNIFIANNEETSNGQFFLYKSNSVGDYITFDVDVAQAGTYDIALDYWGIAKRGAVQLSIDGTNVGAVVDQHTSPDGSGTAMIGEYNFSAAGVYKFTFTNTQRNASSSSDKFSIDAIRLN